MPPAKAKLIGYVTMRDGSLIECYYKFNVFPYACALLVIMVAVVLATILYVVNSKQDIFFGDKPIKVGDDFDLVQFNEFMQYNPYASKVDIYFKNGDLPVTIQLVGDGIESEPIEVEAGQTISTVNVRYTGKEQIVNAKLIIISETSRSEQDVTIKTIVDGVVSKPSGSTGSDGEPTYGDSPWRGEYIFD